MQPSFINRKSANTKLWRTLVAAMKIGCDAIGQIHLSPAEALPRSIILVRTIRENKGCNISKHHGDIAIYLRDHTSSRKDANVQHISWVLC